MIKRCNALQNIQKGSVNSVRICEKSNKMRQDKQWQFFRKVKF